MQCKISAAISGTGFLLQVIGVKVCRTSALPNTKRSLSSAEMQRVYQEAPILVFPHFDLQASHFVLQTDASAGGLGAILQQNGHAIDYASCVLNKAECNYSVIQRECLAAVCGMKQFRHYLLGRPFEHWTNHEPLMWLTNQGMLGHWPLALQEYSFTVVYCRGSQNTNADALSRW